MFTANHKKGKIFENVGVDSTERGTYAAMRSSRFMEAGREYHVDLYRVSSRGNSLAGALTVVDRS